MKFVKFKEEGLDVDFMPDVVAADYDQGKKSAPLMLWGIGITLLILIIWASFGEIDEITRGEGKIIPSTKLQVVEHLEGGIIQKILVHEGDIVNKGQLLLRIDSTVAQARYQEGRTLYYRYLVAVTRLRAQIDGKDFKVPSEVLEKAPKEAEDAMTLYKAHLESLQNEVSIATQEVEQKQQELNELLNRGEELQKQLALTEDKIKIIAPLVEKKLEPEIALTDLKIRQSEIRQEAGAIPAKRARATAALEQAQQRLKQVPIKFKAENLNELKEASNRLASAQQDFTSEGDRYSRTEVRSPVRGIVKQLLVTTVGGVVKPGDDLIEIVPLEDTLLIEAHVSPRDIAFLRPGLPASIKITAYDYSIYGDLRGELLRVSADSITDQKGNTFYKAYLRTNGTILSKAKKPLPIIPGMVASVDILTGKKTVMDYLLKPILKVRERALRER